MIFKKKSYEEIMNNIIAGLTGDPNKDFTYIAKQQKKYRKHEYGDKIIKACNEIIYSILPDDVVGILDELNESYKHEMNDIYSLLSNKWSCVKI